MLRAVHRQHLWAAAFCATTGACSLVIGDIPPAGKGNAGSGGSGGDGGSGASGGGGDGGSSSSGGDANGGSGTRSAGGFGSGGEAGALLETSSSAGGSSGANATATGGASSGGGIGTGGGTASGGGTQASGGSGGSGGSETSSGGSSGCSDPCDCDDDGALSKACDGDDCDDTDDRVKPGQAEYFTEPVDSVGFDYNCSGKLETNGESLSCGLVCNEDEQGYLGSAPSCGNPGSWGRCKSGTLTCSMEELDAARVLRCH